MFYNQNIDIPLSQYLNTDEFDNSPLGELAEGSSLEELRYHPHWARIKTAEKAWRVVGAWYPDEDNTITRFQAFGENGEHLSAARFGVNYDEAGRISLKGFKYTPWHGDRYYVPIDNRIHTPNTGGYWVEVLDTEYPSEAMKFGMNKSGKQHKCLVINFRLMSLDGDSYPK